MVPSYGGMLLSVSGRNPMEILYPLGLNTLFMSYLSSMHTTERLQSQALVLQMTKDLTNVSVQYWPSCLDAYFLRSNRKDTMEIEPELDAIVKIRRSPGDTDRRYQRVWCRWKDPLSAGSIETWHFRHTLEQNPIYAHAIADFAQKQGFIKDPDHPYNIPFHQWQQVLDKYFQRKD